MTTRPRRARECAGLTMTPARYRAQLAALYLLAAAVLVICWWVAR